MFVFVESLVVCAGDNAVDAVTHEQGQVFAFALGSAHRITDEDAVSGFGQRVFDLDGELAEKGRETAGTINPTVWVLLPCRARASELGRYPRASMASATERLVLSDR